MSKIGSRGLVFFVMTMWAMPAWAGQAGCAVKGQGLMSEKKDDLKEQMKAVRQARHQKEMKPAAKAATSIWR